MLALGVPHGLGGLVEIVSQRHVPGLLGAGKREGC
jgi:hypothetical protein